MQITVPMDAMFAQVILFAQRVFQGILCFQMYVTPLVLLGIIIIYRLISVWHVKQNVKHVKIIQVACRANRIII